MSETQAPETVRLLSEIAHKLDYAINSAKKLADTGAEGGGQVDSSILMTPMRNV